MKVFLEGHGLTVSAGFSERSVKAVVALVTTKLGIPAWDLVDTGAPHAALAGAPPIASTVVVWRLWWLWGEAL